MSGEEGDFVFLSNGSEISPAKEGEIIFDPINMDFNDKKIQNLLYKKLEGVYNRGDLVVKFSDLTAKAENFLLDVFAEVSLSLSYEEIGVLEIIKAFSVKISRDYESFLEKLICYVNILIELKNCKFVVFVNLKSFLSDQDLSVFYSHCLREKISLLLIENSLLRPLLPCEKAVVITSDLCEILVNYSDK